MPEFRFQDMLPLGEDETPYHLVTKDYVSTFSAAGQSFLRVDREALRLLTRQAMRDIAHLLRPGHLAQLAAILKDPDVQARFKQLSTDPVGNTPEEFAAFQKAEIAKWAKVVKDGNIKAD